MFMEMGTSDQSDASKIKDKLIEAFSDSAFVAYTKLNGKERQLIYMSMS